MEIFYHQILNDGAVKEECQVKIPSRFAALENVDDDDDENINTIKKNTEASVRGY
jgi:hypothetical protein